MANRTGPIPTIDGDRAGAALSAGGPKPTPLGPVLVFVALNSVGTGAVQTGVFFLLRSAYGFGAFDNFLFGFFLYTAYVAGALAVGPLMQRATRSSRAPGARGTAIGRRAGAMSVRTIIGCLVAFQAMVGLVPQTVAWILDVPTPPMWTVWIVGVSFGLLTGMMWPIAESFLSGGRTGRALSAATGKFNIVWSSAVVAAFWLMAPLLEESPITVITVLSFVQFASVVCLAWFPSEPARHVVGVVRAHPASWHRLLAWFRVLLPVGYVLCGALSPLLPSVVDRVGVEQAWMTPVASAWVTSRVVVFVLFERWHAWHGRAWMAWLAAGCLVGGFAATVLLPPSAGVWALIGVLGVFGLGHATAYVGALYYAMELGDAEIDAGGTHEALIGAGYAAGPIVGLLAIAGARTQMGDRFDAWMIGLVALLVVSALAVAAVRIRGGRPDARAE